MKKIFVTITFFVAAVQLKADNCNIIVYIHNLSISDVNLLSGSGDKLFGYPYLIKPGATVKFNSHNDEGLFAGGVEGSALIGLAENNYADRVTFSFSNPWVGMSHYFVSYQGCFQGRITSIYRSRDPQEISIEITGGRNKPPVTPGPRTFNFPLGGTTGRIHAYLRWNFATGQPTGKLADALKIQAWVPTKFTENASGSDTYKNIKGNFSHYELVKTSITFKRMNDSDSGFVYQCTIDGIPYDESSTGNPLLFELTSLPVLWNQGEGVPLVPPRKGCVYTAICVPDNQEQYAKAIVTHYQVFNFSCYGAWVDPTTGDILGENAGSLNALLKKLKNTDKLSLSGAQILKYNMQQTAIQNKNIQELKLEKKQDRNKETLHSGELKINRPNKPIAKPINKQ